ncbi:MAG: hypothetical protein HQ526_03735, partial [Actinobacteria bacterium]|nr:hypothetical protein [Actinomycetota bacterium]
ATVPGGTAVVVNEGAGFVVKVTGLGAGVTATATVTTTRTDYAPGSSTVPGTSLRAAYVPEFGPVVRAPNGFSAVITNYDGNYEWVASAAPGAATITNVDAVYSVTVTGIDSGGVRSTATVTAASDTSVTGSAPISGRSTLPVLTPDFDPTVRGVFGFTAQLLNYDPDYNWVVTTTAGAASLVPTPVGEDIQQILTVTGLTDGQAADVTVTTTVPGTSVTGSKIVDSSALDGALVPEFATSVPLDGSFSAEIPDYDPAFTWNLFATAGTPTINTLVSPAQLVVTGLDVGEASTVTVTTVQDGYRDGSSTASGRSLQEAKTPVFGPVTRDDGGFTVSIIDYDPTFTWNVTEPTVGTVNSSGQLVVTNVPAGQTVTAAVTTTKVGFFTGTNSVPGTALDEALVPDFGTSQPQDGGFTAEIINYDPSFDWNLTATAGSVGIDTATGTDLLVVTGLGIGKSSTVKVDTAKAGYLPGTNSTDGESIRAAFNPAFAPVTRTADGFTSEITNYVAGFDLVWETTAGTWRLDTDGPTAYLEVTGLNPGDRATVTVATSQDGYFDGTGEVSGRAIRGGALPDFGTPVQEANGFTAPITNYDPYYSWTVTSTPGTAAIVESTVDDVVEGSVVVSGLTDGQSATATVVRTPPEGAATENLVTSSALAGARVPALGDPVPADGGFSIPITNYDGAFDWDPQTTAGSASIDTSGAPQVVVTGLGVGETATVTVATSQEGYRDGTSTEDGTSTKAALNPTFGTAVPGDLSFTIPITNYNAAFTWNVQATAGTPSIDTSGVQAMVVVTGLTDGETSEVTVTTSQQPAFFDGSATTPGIALQAAYQPDLAGTATEGNRSFTIDILNYDSDYQWSAESEAGSASVEYLNSQWVVVVSGLEPQVPTTVTVKAKRDGYKEGTDSASGQAAVGGQKNPEFDSAIPTGDGFRAEITNYDPAFTWAATSTRGQAAVVDQNATYFLAVTGVDPNTAVSATVTTNRENYDEGSATTSATSLKAKRDPVLDNESRLNQAFTVEIQNFSSKYTWTATSTIGNAFVSDQGLVRVTGLPPGQTADLEVMSNRPGYAQGVALVDAESLSAPLVPQFSAASPTANGFTTQVTNYSSAYNWSVVGTPGQASISGSGRVTVSGLGSGVGSTVSVTTTRAGYQAGTASIVGQAAVYIPPAKPPTKPQITKVKVQRGKVRIGYYSQSGAPITSARAVCRAPGSKRIGTGRGSMLTVKKLKRGKRYKCWVQASNVFGKSANSRKVKFKAK